MSEIVKESETGSTNDFDSWLWGWDCGQTNSFNRPRHNLGDDDDTCWRHETGRRIQLDKSRRFPDPPRTSAASDQVRENSVSFLLRSGGHATSTVSLALYAK